MGFKALKYVMGVLLLAIAYPAASRGPSQTEPQNTVKFTENKKQWDPKVLFRAQLDGGAMFLEKDCFTYNFYDKEALRANHAHNKANAYNSEIRFHAFRMSFLNALSTVQTSSKQVTPDYCNYFIGKDKNKWAGNVKNYREVNYKDLYQGIDLQVLGLQNSLKYNFIVAPMADPNEIQLSYAGLDDIYLEKGALNLKTSIT